MNLTRNKLLFHKVIEHIGGKIFIFLDKLYNFDRVK